MDQVSNKLFKGAAWLTLTRLLVNALSVISTFVLARLLTPSDFGIVAIATSILAVALSITDLSLGSALVQRTELIDDHFHSVWTIGLIRSLVIFGAIALIAYPLALLYHEPRLTAVLVATGFIAALSGCVSPKMVILTRNLVFWQEFIVQVTQKSSIFIASVVIAILFHTYWALIIGNLIGTICSVIVSFVISPYNPRISFAKFRELFSYSFWLSMGDTINTLNWKFDQLVLGYLIGKAPLGIYTVADNIAALPVRESTTPLTKALFPALARIAGDPNRLKSGYTRAQSMTCAIAMPVGFGFAAIAHPVVVLFLGQKWLGAIPIIQILSMTFSFQSMTAGLESLAMATGETKLLFGRDVRTFLIRIPFIIIGFISGGLMGVVVARAASSTLSVFWNMTLVTKLAGVSVFDQFRVCYRIFLSTAVMLISIFGVENALSASSSLFVTIVNCFLITVVGAVVYGGISTALWFATGRPEGPESDVYGILARQFRAGSVSSL